jgi:hypothetical protein
MLCELHGYKVNQTHEMSLTEGALGYRPAGQVLFVLFSGFFGFFGRRQAADIAQTQTPRAQHQYWRLYNRKRHLTLDALSVNWLAWSAGRTNPQAKRLEWGASI